MALLPWCRGAIAAAAAEWRVAPPGILRIPEIAGGSAATAARHLTGPTRKGSGSAALDRPGLASVPHLTGWPCITAVAVPDRPALHHPIGKGSGSDAKLACQALPLHLTGPPCIKARLKAEALHRSDWGRGPGPASSSSEGSGSGAASGRWGIHIVLYAASCTTPVKPLARRRSSTCPIRRGLSARVDGWAALS